MSAQTHPPAVVQRQQERDAKFLFPIIAGLGQRQYQLFFLVQATLHKLAQSGEFPVDDAVVKDTAASLASTYETATKGIIYEHRATSLPAEHLARELKPLLEGQDGRGPVARESDLVEVLRRIERAAGAARDVLEGDDRAYLELVGRLLRPAPGQGRPASDDEGGEPAPADGGPSLIIP